MMFGKNSLCVAMLVGVVCLFAMSSVGELQNVQIGGEVRVRGSFWRNTHDFGVTPWFVLPTLRIPADMMTARPVGDPFLGQSVTSFWDWDTRGANRRLVNQRTTVNVSADFTEQVRAFIELERFDIWGDDFRSDYLTGADRSAADGRVSLYQSYIEAAELFGFPLRLRLGRQELAFGSHWLIGNNSRHPQFSGLFFDAARLTYGGPTFTADVFWAKLDERGLLEEDGDVDLYGIYASCMAVDNWNFDAYWFWLRDARAVNDTQLGFVGEWIEDLLCLDDYDTTNLHTVGLRAAGIAGGLDVNAEVAYQFGDAGQVGRLFRPFTYGDDNAKFSSWAADCEVGFTFDSPWQPRVYVGGAYFGGEDNRGINFWEWLFPINRARASVSFNRLFSNRVYSPILDDVGALSNFWTLRGGVQASPTDNLGFKVNVSYFESVAQFDHPWPRPLYWRDFIFTVAHPFSFITERSSSKLGWETNVAATYRYSEDLTFEIGWAHLFTARGLTDGNFIDLNGLLFSGGKNDKDADYFYCEARLAF